MKDALRASARVDGHRSLDERFGDRLGDKEVVDLLRRYLTASEFELGATGEGPDEEVLRALREARHQVDQLKQRLGDRTD